jgi:hypothetical protein
LHFWHVSLFSAWYTGTNALTLGSAVSCSRNSLSATILFQQPQLGHFILSFMVGPRCNAVRLFVRFGACTLDFLALGAVFFGYFPLRTSTFSNFISQSHWRVSPISFSSRSEVSPLASGTKLITIKAVLFILAPIDIKGAEYF